MKVEDMQDRKTKSEVKKNISISGSSKFISVFEDDSRVGSWFYDPINRETYFYPLPLILNTEAFIIAAITTIL